MWSDIRHAFRLMQRSPIFTAVAVLSLALGIGANSAVFSLLNAVVLRPLPVRDPASLVSIETVRPNGTRGGFSFPAFEELGRRQRSCAAWIGFWGDGVFTAEASGALVQADIWAVTGNFYDELGVRPFAGRLLTADDVALDTRTPAMVAVIGHGLWQRVFGGDASAVGRQIRVEGITFTVVGIAPERFTALTTATEPDVTIPLTALPMVTSTGTTDRFRNLKVPWVRAVARLKRGATLDQARAEFANLWPPVRAALTPPDYIGHDRENFLATGVEVTSAATGVEIFLRSRFTRPLEVVLGVAALILLIACVNLASLMLSRAAARGHETAVRVALGASRWRLVRQLFVEGLTISGLGACGALIFAGWSSRAIATLMTRDYLVPSALDVAPDRRGLLFTATIAIAVGILFSIVPAWRASGQAPAGALQRAGRGTSRVGRIGKALIIVQVALSVSLLVDAGLLVRTLEQLRAVAPGFHAEGVTVAKLFSQPGGYREFNPGEYYPEMVERIAALPGVEDVGLTQVRPGGGYMPRGTIAPAADPAAGEVPSAIALVGPRFFSTLRIALLAGRDFTWADRADSRRVGVVSRSLADRLFSGTTAIGRTIMVTGEATHGEIEVVGVVSDVQIVDSRDPTSATLYVPLLQEPAIARYGDLLLRVGPSFSVAALRKAVQSGGREYVLWYRPYQDLLDRAILQERVTAMLAGFFGALALLLAAIGLYGLIAYDVAQRTREMGIRVALGAERLDIVRMVARDALGLVLLGVAIGGPVAVLAGRFVASLLFGLTPSDPVTFVEVAALLVGVGGLAGSIPAWRAATVNPIDALRT